MTLRQHIEFLRRVYVVTHNAGKVDRNCELLGILVMFGLRQLRQSALLRLPIFWFSRKIFYCQLRDANSIMSTCDISKHERNISIFEHFMTKFHEFPEQPSYITNNTIVFGNDINSNM